MKLLKYEIKLINVMDTPVDELIHEFSVKCVFESTEINGYVIRVYKVIS